MAHWPVGLFAATLALFLFTGCESTTSSSGVSTAQPVPRATPDCHAQRAARREPAAAPVAAAAIAGRDRGSRPVGDQDDVLPPVRIKAGGSSRSRTRMATLGFPTQGFADGETVERPDAQITGTTSPAIYRAERYSMTSFTYPVPNGKYTVKLHFCETYEGITDKGQRVFSFSVRGHETKDLDVFDKAGGAHHAYVVTVPVEVTNGKVDITFHSQRRESRDQRD